MQEINAKYNLKSLLENYRVVIPLIQRDYAQGRKDKSCLLYTSQLRVRELITFFQDISENGLSKVEIQALLQFKDDQYQQFADKLSGGQKRLLAFVLCLIGKPDILFLDEPTAGMDTTTRQRFWEIINDLKKSGVTILYSSHYIEEVEHTACLLYTSCQIITKIIFDSCKEIFVFYKIYW